jgi:cell division GTPase FtsZ
MGVSSKKQKIEKQDIVDDVTIEEKSTEKEQEKVDADRVKALKKRLLEKKEKENDMPPRIVEEKKRSIRMGVIGSGQAGSRLAEVFYKLGYESVAINTAPQDLEHIDMPEANKLLLEHGLGGAAKELNIGASAAEAYRDAINELVNKKLGDAQMLLFCTSLGGGSGAGSVETVIDILTGMECPIAVITILPQNSDDAQVKSNAVTTLAKFTKMAQENQIVNLIVADNAKIESIYSDVGPLNFFSVSNQAIVDPIDKFNTLSTISSPIKALDSTEFGKLFTDGQGLSVYGTIKVHNYEDEDAIAGAIFDDLKSNLLASGFELKQTRYAGAMFVASEKVWNKIPTSSIDYAMDMIGDACGTPRNKFKGIYVVDSEEDAVIVYSFFSGLGLPTDRIEQLRTEAKERTAQVDEKDEKRNLTLKLDTGDENVNKAEQIKERIKRKKSKFGQLHGKAVIDRRKR